MNKSQRYSLIDAIRGIAVVNMVVYHLCYDIFCAFGVWSSFYRAVPVIIWERLICSTFIIISGISLHFTRHGFRRGLIVSLCGIVTTVVTVIFTPDQSIFFGVLSFLGCAMLLTYALRRLLDRMNPYVGAILFFLLFALCYNIPNGTLGFFSAPLVHLPDALYQFKWLAFLGFPSNDFFSADYFPLLPWLFLYLFGYQLWRIITQRRLERLFLGKIPVLDFIGRHSLIIYMAHQPILYGICYLFFEVL
nr:heparan-alpha-glucosaminide N-acetyltransferase [uncultured Ruminococcus sp.]